MKRLEITRLQYAIICDLQVAPRPDWDAWFGVNNSENIWPGVGRGRTPPEKRQEIQDVLPLLNRVRDEYLLVRSEGGRVFVDQSGAHHKRDGHAKLFVSFVFEE